MTPKDPDLKNPPLISYKLGTKVLCGNTTVSFDDAASISFLLYEGRNYASSGQPLGRILYQVNSDKEQHAYRDLAMWPPCNSDCNGCGFIKCNSDFGGARSLNENVDVVAAFYNPEECRFVFNSTFSSHLQRSFGAPEVVWIEAKVSKVAGAVDWNVTYMGKGPTRLPESLWMQFAPALNEEEAESWLINKLGQWVSPFDSAKNGSSTTHGVWEGVSVPGIISIGSVEIPLIVVGSPSPLKFLGDKELNLGEVTKYGISYNIFNNQWNTNYPVFLFDTQFKCSFSMSLGK